MKLLKFGKGNMKIGKNVYTFSLPAGYTCPNANECLAKADKQTGKVTQGKETIFRCFAASDEGRYPNVRLMRWHNFELLKGCISKEGSIKTFQRMKRLISNSLPENANIIRIHASGDFFNSAYFAAWMDVARENPETIFYFYTKMASYVVKYKNYMPENFVYTISKGGKQDSLIPIYNLRYTQVVYSEDEAKQLGLEIDHDDTHAQKKGNNFALLIHGSQTPGSKAGEALKIINREKRRVPLTVIPFPAKL